MRTGGRHPAKQSGDPIAPGDSCNAPNNASVRTNQQRFCAARPAKPEYHDVIAQLIEAAARRPNPYRDMALVWLLVSTNLTPIEIAMLQIRDYIDRDGGVRVLSRIDAKRAFNGRERPLVFVNQRLRAALDAYLEQRRIGGEPGTARRFHYRGLRPDAALILDDHGNPLRVTERRTAAGVHRICGPMHTLCRSIFQSARITHLTARDGKKLFAQALYDMGADPEAMRLLLGLKRRTTLLRMLPIEKNEQSEARRLLPLISQIG
jgi:integrase